jgi:hypothetical protein
MKYTKKQRREIYLDAAYCLFKGKENVICWAIWKVSRKSCLVFICDITIRVKEDFPEFAIFDPHVAGSYWFGVPHFTDTATTNQQRQNRINCLLLCAEMCNDI